MSVSLKRKQGPGEKAPDQMAPLEETSTPVEQVARSESPADRVKRIEEQLKSLPAEVGRDGFIESRKKELDEEYLRKIAEIESTTGQPLSFEARQEIYSNTVGSELETLTSQRKEWDRRKAGEQIPTQEQKLGLEFAELELSDFKESLRLLSRALNRAETIDPASWSILVKTVGELEASNPAQMKIEDLNRLIVKATQSLNDIQRRKPVKMPRRDDVDTVAMLPRSLTSVVEKIGSLSSRIKNESGDSMQETIALLGLLRTAAEQKARDINTLRRRMEEML